MAYIVDLIIIMWTIFFISKARPDRVVRPEEVEDVLRQFEANQCDDIHTDIRSFVQEMSVLKAIWGKGHYFQKDSGADRQSLRQKILHMLKEKILVVKLVYQSMLAFGITMDYWVDCLLREPHSTIPSEQSGQSSSAFFTVFYFMFFPAPFLHQSRYRCGRILTSVILGLSEQLSLPPMKMR